MARLSQRLKQQHEGPAVVDTIRRALAAAGDPERAVLQQRYMKSELPYRGLSSPELKALLRPILKDWQPVDRDDWRLSVLALWDGATHREEWYAAIALARHRTAAAWRDVSAFELWRHLITTGAWWDVVDDVAQHLVGPTLLGHREAVRPMLLDWAVDDDPWLRRTAVICQVGHRDDTDTVLLRRAIEPNLTDSSFWLRKAIGWALRDYARTDPDWVRAEVDRLGDRLSGLSRREALKHL